MFVELYNDLTSCWLDSIALATMRVCIEQTLKIETLTATGLKQLIMDLRKLKYNFFVLKFRFLEYLSSVLEDFGLKDVADFRDMLDLLSVDKDKFEEVARKKQAQMGTAIRKMRDL